MFFCLLNELFSFDGGSERSSRRAQQWTVSGNQLSGSVWFLIPLTVSPS